MKLPLPGSLLLLVLLAAPGRAQANADPSIDVRLGGLTGLAALGRTGTYPGGENGLAMETTACNVGSADVPWLAPMAADHPLIAFLLARDDGTRMRQVSRRSWVKHAFFAVGNDACETCRSSSPQGEFLGVGCSDTYSTVNNGDRFWLGPPDEVDPWLGEWEPTCSHFDAGEPPVAPPADCDDVRSLTKKKANALGPTAHRVVVSDADLLDDGPERLFYQACYVVRREPEGHRADNVGWREVQPTWVGSTWIFSNLSDLAHGSVLEGWKSAQVSSAAGGADDGRVYVAVKVTGPLEGVWHYEYAVHNRDLARGVGAFRVPVCSEALVWDGGYADPDGDPSNDWVLSRQGDELVWASGDAPLRWNGIRNFWFDSDAAPMDGEAASVEAFDGGGTPSLSVPTRAPTGLFNFHLGPGCSAGSAPQLTASGIPAKAEIGNGGFTVVALDCAPFTPVLFSYSAQPAELAVGGGCTVYVQPPSFSKVKLADFAGRAALALPIPEDPSLEGLTIAVQAFELDPAGGQLSKLWDVSNGLGVRVGDEIPSCP